MRRCRVALFTPMNFPIGHASTARIALPAKERA
jgi:hypothetical protein